MIEPSVSLVESPGSAEASHSILNTDQTMWIKRLSRAFAVCTIAFLVKQITLIFEQLKWQSLKKEGKIKKRLMLLYRGQG